MMHFCTELIALIPTSSRLWSINFIENGTLLIKSAIAMNQIDLTLLLYFNFYYIY